MANATKCLTDGAIFRTKIESFHGYYSGKITAEVLTPFRLDNILDEEEAELLETLIHNQLELVLRSYFESR